MPARSKKPAAKKPAKKKWMAKAFPEETRGALHRDLGVPEDEPIPAEKLQAATKKKGKVGARARAGVIGKKIARKKK